MSRRDPASAAELVATGGKGERGSNLVLVKDWLRGAVVDNLALKAVAFLLALTLFILVHSDEDQIVPFSVTLSQPTPREGLTLVHDLPADVRVNIKGSRRQLRRLVEEKLQPIQVTLTSTGEFVFRSDMIRPLREGLSVVSISPPSISLVFESTKDKSVAVRPRVTGTPASGYRVVAVRSVPDRFDVRGAESAIGKLEELITEALDIGGAKVNVEKSVSLAVPPVRANVVSGGSARAPQEIEVAVVVEIEPSQSQLLIDLTPIEVRGGDGVTAEEASVFRLDPPNLELTLRGDQLVLDGIDRTAIKPFVRVYSGDVVAQAPRQATIELDGVPQGVAVEIRPASARLLPK